MDASFLTPNLDRLAAESIAFTNAFCTTPQCSPSRSSMLTGCYPTRTGVLGNIGAAGGDPLRMPTIGAALRAAGYRTAYFGKWHLGKDPRGTAGWDEEHGVSGPEVGDDREVTRRAQAFLRHASRAQQPFAIFLSYVNPHDIYHFGREAEPAPRTPVALPRTWHDKDLSTTPAVQKQFMTDDQGRIIAPDKRPGWQRYRELYRDKVKCFDNELGQVLETLDASGLADTTLVMSTSDHGDMDGQHGLIYKGPFMYEHMMRVPLIVRMPKADRLPPRMETFHTVNVDLAPTIADVAGAAFPDCDGVSLNPLLSRPGRMPGREFVIGQYYSKQKWVNPIRMIRTAHYKYNLYRRHGEELYDLTEDPEEIVNRASDAQCLHIKDELNKLLKQWLAAHDDPFETQNPTTRDGRTLPERNSHEP